MDKNMEMLVKLSSYFKVVKYLLVVRIFRKNIGKF